MVYRWTGSAWEMLSFPDVNDGRNALYYLEALGDTTNNAPNAVFNNAQIRSIVASSIFADLIGAKQIIVSQNGYIRSAETDPITRKPLLLINKDGIEAINALFKDIRILGDSYFEGDIYSGPLELNSRNPSNIQNVNVWNVGTSYQNFYNYITSLPLRTPVDGMFDTVPFTFFERKVGIKNETLFAFYDKDWHGVNIPGGRPLTLDGVTTNSIINMTNNYGNWVNLAYTIQIGFYNPSGRTIKLNNLPRNEPTLVGALWVDSAGFLRIKM